MHPSNTAFTGKALQEDEEESLNTRDAVVPEEDWQAGRKGEQQGTGGGQELAADLVSWLAWSGGGPDQMAGLVRWLAGSGGGQGGWRGMDLQSKEFSGLNIFE